MSHKDEEEEEDYMSEAFLNSLVADETTKSKGKANMTYSERRRQKEREHLANLPKPLHVREKEAREQGLEKEIGEDNKGMAMLLKMGFKKGGTLGASKPASEPTTTSITTAPSGLNPPSTISSENGGGALRAPLAIQIKQGRGGLGMDTSRKRQAEEQLQRQEQEVHRVFDEGFRGQKRDQFEMEKRKRQLGAARAICMRLDSKKAETESQYRTEQGDTDTTTPQVAKGGRRSNRFWWIDDSMPDEVLGTKLMGPGAAVLLDLEQEQDSQSTEGRAFDHSDDEDGDLERNKAKRVRLDSSVSQKVDQTDSQDEEPPKWGERPNFAQLEIHEKLEEVVAYLRSEHSYCFWCSAQYDGPEDIAENCPGELEEDH
ncbi:hypothetical protein BG015_006981 [Linnemannia schmuckeri]|uniref:G-patch domain-containing protein n=1 Tax=Linnemannia schmuckeri TaxID=64567 RepID=A0A9P5S2P9_9FUNG|nr:hypothetical protein BG015_006981 [Linnemannia schmuckeri]